MPVPRSRVKLSLLCISFLLLMSCGQEEKTKNGDSASNDTVNVSTEPDALAHGEQPKENETGVDTIFALKIGGKAYQLVLFNDYFISMEYGTVPCMTVHIVESASNDTIFSETFRDFNYFARLENPAPGKYWLGLLNSGGGSGFSAALFNVKIAPEPKLQPIFKYNELSFFKGNRTGTALLFFQASWLTNPEGEPETHFEPHRQGVAIYEIREDSVIYKDLGDTQGKYDLSVDEDALKQLPLIRKNEPELAEKIPWEDFD